MRCKLVGIKPVDYISKKTGKQVTGSNLYITHPADRVDGLVAEDVYIRDGFEMPVLFIGDEIDVYFNRYGGVDQIVRVQGAGASSVSQDKKVG